MTTPISFTIRPPSSTAPARPSPLGNGQNGSRSGSWRAGPPSRRAFEQGDSDNDEEEDGARRRRNERAQGKQEKIEGFGNGKALGYVRLKVVRDPTYTRPAVSGSKAPEAMTIAPLPNRDWRQSSTATARRTPSYRPETTRSNEPPVLHERVGDEPQRSGLRFAVKTDITEEVKQDNVGVIVKTESIITSATTVLPINGSLPPAVDTLVKSEPLSLEEQALQALLAGDVATETDEERAQRELVIGMQANGNGVQPADEADAFRRDVATRPDESSIEDYESVPVSAFGLAIVRGMGYDPSKEKAIHIPKARPHLLGIGATALDIPAPSSKSAASKKKKEDYSKRGGRGYVPNLLLKKEREGSGARTLSVESSRQTSPNGDSDSSRRRRYETEDDGGREGKRRERDNDGYSRRREGYREERDVDGRKRDDRDRYRDKETEEERARRKAKERERSGNGDRDGARRVHDEREKDRYRADDRERERDREKRRRD
ncbi:hypothetical protein P7C73_g1629, partial [Tremellales sp. Uapishka_1]